MPLATAARPPRVLALAQESVWVGAPVGAPVLVAVLAPVRVEALVRVAVMAPVQAQAVATGREKEKAQVSIPYLEPGRY